MGLLLIGVLALLNIPFGKSMIYHLNATEYERMPPIYYLDPYEPCVNEKGGLYCSVKFHLVSEGPNEIYDLIKNYSERSVTHFNHSQLSHGYCLTRTCMKFYQGNTTRDPSVVLEACLNETIWRDYRLKTRVVNDRVRCFKLHKDFNITASDIVVAVLILVLILLNVIGNIWEFCFNTSKKQDLNLMSCFSIRRNWVRLVMPAGVGPEPRLSRLKGLYGIRALNMILVIAGHALLPFLHDLENTQFLEETYNDMFYLIVTNSTVIIQTFFVMSGFLLAYNLQLHREKHRVTWVILPTGVFKRYLRLTPPYVVILAFTATWMQYVGSGPLWHTIVGDEVEHCRKYWWLNVLYVNNYVDYSHCMPQTWYIASDIQLHILGLAVCVLSSGRTRRVLLGILLAAGLLMPALHTYFQDLDPLLLLSPEVARNWFIEDPTFNHTYKRGHTNLASFVIGLIAGLLLYHCQQTDYKIPKFWKHRIVFWLNCPVMTGIIMLGAIFYRDAPRDPALARAVYAAFAKPLFGATIAFLIFGMVYKFENVYRGILEWRGWAVPARLTYCSYLIHVAFARYLTATRTTLLHGSLMHVFELVIGCIVIAFVMALPYHLLVEAPLQELIKLCLNGRRKRQTEIPTTTPTPTPNTPAAKEKVKVTIMDNTTLI